LLFLLGFLTILFHLGTSGLLETSEGRYASVGRAMLDTGDWLIPVHNGLRHLTKPPVTYWASALGMKLFGINEFGARFFLAIAAGFTALGCFFIGRALFSPSTGIIASLILTCSLFFQIQFRGLTTDPYLTMFETFMVFAFLGYLQSQRKWQKVRFSIFFWLMAAFAMLTKGPPGLLPLIGLIPAALLNGQKSQLKSLFKSIFGWSVFIIVGLGWYLYLTLKIPGLLQYFLIDETLNRVASSQHDRSAPFYLFFVLLPVGVFPWTSFFIRGLKNVINGRRENFSHLFLLLWLCAPLLVFSLSRSKLAAYVLPLLVPVAIIAAVGIRDIFRSFSAKNSDYRFHVRVIGSFLVLIGIAMGVYGFSGSLVSASLNSSMKFCGAVWAFLGIFLIWQTWFGNRLISLTLLCLVAPGLIFFTIPGIRGNEELKPGKYLSSQWLLLKRLANLPPEQQIINIEEMIEGWYFYTGRNPITWNVSRIKKFDPEISQKLALEGDEALSQVVDTNSMLVIRKKDLARVSDSLNYNLKAIASEGKWLVTIPERRIRP
jgi:hypothetical protein